MGYLPQYVLGIDVSKWQGKMDWAKAVLAGAKFAIIRAGYGYTTPNTDTEFERNSTIAPDYLPVGYYWFWKPSLSALTQTDYFCDLIKNKRWNIRPVIDVEISDGLSTTVMRDRLKQFAERVVYRLGVNPIIYTRTSFFDPSVLTDPLWGTLDLHIARYSETLSHPWGDGYGDPRDWNDWVFWQFSADGNMQGATFGAESSSIDLDYFNGTQQQFETYAKITQEPPVEVGMITLIDNRQKTISASDGGGTVVATVPDNETWEISLINFQITESPAELRVLVRNKENKSAVLTEVASPIAGKLYVTKNADLQLTPGNKLVLSVTDNLVDLNAKLSYAGVKTVSA